MDDHGFLTPDDAEAVREQFEALGPAAQTVVKETAKAMEFDREEYDERVTTAVVTTAREALFASLLRVHVGTRAEFDEWVAAEGGDYEVQVEGSEQVEQIAWHAVPFAATVVAATFQNEEEAAIGTLRRIAFGRFYRDVL